MDLVLPEPEYTLLVNLSLPEPNLSSGSNQSILGHGIVETKFDGSLQQGIFKSPESQLAYLNARCRTRTNWVYSKVMRPSRHRHTEYRAPIPCILQERCAVYGFCKLIDQIARTLFCQLLE